jgi:hypothetical protein
LRVWGYMSNQDQERLLKVCTLENRFEADQISEALKNEGIPFWIKEYSDTAYNGIYVVRKGWASLWVPALYEASAREVIARFREDFGNQSWILWHTKAEQIP